MNAYDQAADAALSLVLTGPDGAKELGELLAGGFTVQDRELQRCFVKAIVQAYCGEIVLHKEVYVAAQDPRVRAQANALAEMHGFPRDKAG